MERCRIGTVNARKGPSAAPGLDGTARSPRAIRPAGPTLSQGLFHVEQPHQPLQGDAWASPELQTRQ